MKIYREERSRRRKGPYQKGRTPGQLTIGKGDRESGVKGGPKCETRRKRSLHEEGVASSFSSYPSMEFHLYWVLRESEGKGVYIACGGVYHQKRFIRRE